VIEDNGRRKHVVPTLYSGIGDDGDDDDEMDYAKLVHSTQCTYLY
jgi:hypothetical protein